MLDGRVQFRQNIMMKHNAMFVTNKGTLMEDPLQEPLSQKAFRYVYLCIGVPIAVHWGTYSCALGYL